MNLSQAKLNHVYEIVSVNINNEKLKLRLEELGMFQGEKVEVKKFSVLKKTMLIRIFNSLFTLKVQIAKNIIIKSSVALV